MKINELRVELVNGDSNLLGFACLVIDDSIKIQSIAIYSAINSPHGIRLGFPRKEHKGNRFNLVYPINKCAYDELTKAVANEYHELMKKLGRTQRQWEKSKAGII